MNTAKSINPATEELISEYEYIDVPEAKRKLTVAKEAFGAWKMTGFEERSYLMRKLAEVIESNKDKYAQLATREMGKTIGQARKELEKCALVCRYYADNVETLLAEETVATEASKSYVTFQPIGIILAVMPWNFPFYQVIRFAAPAAMAGNVGALKHAPNVQGCARALESAFAEAGFPEGILTNLNVTTDDVEDVIKDRRIAAVTLTGSEAAGRSVASIAGQHLKKTVLELGGSDAYIILDDVGLEVATDVATQGRLQNNGQTCIAAKRFVVLDGIYDAFLELYATKMAAAKMGEPTDEATDYGPLARMDLRDKLHEQVEKTVAGGGRLVIGGEIPVRKGAYYPATILADVTPGMVAFDDELFGPVAAVIRARDEAHAITLANDSRFGLGAGVLTGDTARGERVALQLEAGNCFVNKLVASDPRLPFGGIKNSGYGRELAAYGIREFVNVKTVWVE